MSGIKTQASPMYIGPILAGSDLSAKQYYFVTLSSGKLAVAGAGNPILGVLDDKPKADYPGRVQVGGIAVVLAGGTCTQDTGAASDANGKAVNAAGSARVIGVFLDSGSAGDYVRVLLQPTAFAQAADVETVTSGALNPHVPMTYLSVTGTQAYSLADGTVIGQRKRIECRVAASTPVGTLTLNDAATGEPTTHVFGAVGQMIEVEWTSTGWRLLTYRPAGTDAPAAGSTLNPLFLKHDITIADTQDWVLPDGEVPGQIQSFKVAAVSGTPVGTISGLFYDEDGSADGTDINFNAAADAAVVMWDGSRWDPISLTSATIS